MARSSRARVSTEYSYFERPKDQLASVVLANRLKPQGQRLNSLTPQPIRLCSKKPHWVDRPLFSIHQAFLMTAWPSEPWRSSIHLWFRGWKAECQRCLWPIWTNFRRIAQSRLWSLLMRHAIWIVYHQCGLGHEILLFLANYLARVPLAKPTAHAFLLACSLY